MFDVRSHNSEGARRHLVLEARKDADVFLREYIAAAADSLADLDHEPLEANYAAIDAFGALRVIFVEHALIFCVAHFLSFRGDPAVSKENAGN